MPYASNPLVTALAPALSTGLACYGPGLGGSASPRSVGLEDIPYAVAIGLAALGLAWLYVALLRDRARRAGAVQPRCPGCWYPIVVAPEAAASGALRCPECGRRVRSVRDLLRTRRHWRTCAVGVLCLLLAGAAAAWPKARRDGIHSVIPSTLLVVMPMDALDWFAGASIGPDTAQAELDLRVRRGDLAAWQERILLARIGAAARRHDLLWTRGAFFSDGGPPVFAVHDVAALVGDDAFSRWALQEIVSDFIAPETWWLHGGVTGHILALDDGLAVSTLPDLHEAIDEFLLGLEAAVRAPVPRPAPSSFVGMLDAIGAARSVDGGRERDGTAIGLLDRIRAKREQTAAR